jgi:predicted permease
MAVPSMQTLFQDLRFAFRQLAKNRAFTVVAVFTLALGLGANTAIFSVVDTVLLQPLPFPQQNKLVQIQADSPFPKGWIREFQVRAKSFTSVSGYSFNVEYNVTGSGASDRAFGSSVSVNLFDTLGVRPAAGRFFSSSEEQVGQDRVVVLTYPYWQQRFGADPNIVGQSILLDGINREIVGVAPQGVFFPNAETRFWIPISFKAGDPVDAWADSDSFNKRAIGRLKAGIPSTQAQAELRTLHPQMLMMFPWRMPDTWAADVTVRPLLESVVGESSSKLLLLLGCVGLVLLIACANVANLMLARAASRQREMALRSALGASTPRLVRQMLTESVLLAVISGVGGLSVVALSLRSLTLLLPPDTPRLSNIALHPEVFLFALGISVLTGILSGLAPAWNAGNRDIQAALQEASNSALGGSQRFRVSRFLAIGQVAIAVIVITAAGVMLRSLQRLSSVDPGFRTDKTVAAQVSLDRSSCRQPGRCTAFFQSILDRAQGMPGAQSSALADRVPLAGLEQNYVFDAEDHPREAREVAVVAAGRIVSTSYFNLMGIRLIRGSLFTGSDDSGARRAVVVNTSLANRLWPNQDPIGKHIIEVSREPSPGVMDMKAAATIIGVVSDTHHESLAKASDNEVYRPLNPENEWPVMHILVRSNASAASIASGIRNLIAEVNPSVPVTKITTLDDVVASSTASPRALTLLLVSFSLLALGVGSIGVYSLISYTTSWRTREIGLRMALGANKGQIAMLVIRQSLFLTTAGSILGLAGAYSANNILRSFLFETSPDDPLTYASVPVLLSILAVIAAWAPARRAAKIDPLRALRLE